jgi:AcrR family transcriptional regulator
MALRARAVAAEDKEERRDAILDAAESLLLDAPLRIASVAEVAARAGLAKGTVYLYFASKEELLLAVHERRAEAFFQDLYTLLERAPRVEFADLFTLTRRHLIEPPLFLPLAARCLGLMAHSVPPTVAVAFQQRTAARLARGGAGIERRFPVAAARPGRGVETLRRSYALAIGLWELSAAVTGGHPDAPPTASDRPPELIWSYPEELEAALRALWHGMTEAPTGPEAGT